MAYATLDEFLQEFNETQARSIFDDWNIVNLDLDNQEPERSDSTEVDPGTLIYVSEYGYYLTTEGGTTGDEPVTWPTDAGETVTDGTVEWEYLPNTPWDFLNRAINDGSGIIDSYLGAKYTVPISPAPDVLKNICISISGWFVYSRKHQNNEVWEKRYRDAMALLKAIKDGDFYLDGAVSKSKGRVQYAGETKPFANMQF